MVQDHEKTAEVEEAEAVVEVSEAETEIGNVVILAVGTLIFHGDNSAIDVEKINPVEPEAVVVAAAEEADLEVEEAAEVVGVKFFKNSSVIFIKMRKLFFKDLEADLVGVEEVLEVEVDQEDEAEAVEIEDSEEEVVIVEGLEAAAGEVELAEDEIKDRDLINLFQIFQVLKTFIFSV